MREQPAHVKALIGAALGEGSEGMICPETLPAGSRPGSGPALCRWFWEEYGYHVWFITSNARKRLFDFVPPPEEHLP